MEREDVDGRSVVLRGGGAVELGQRMRGRHGDCDRYRGIPGVASSGSADAAAAAAAAAGYGEFLVHEWFGVVLREPASLHGLVGVDLYPVPPAGPVLVEDVDDVPLLEVQTVGGCAGIALEVTVLVQRKHFINWAYSRDRVVHGVLLDRWMPGCWSRYQASQTTVL